jgi:hypothetical protein
MRLLNGCNFHSIKSSKRICPYGPSTVRKMQTDTNLSTYSLWDGNRSLTRALACLAHPTSFISILLLLFNDMVVKYYWPGWISGKLSDLAGLYFFPFLIGVLLSLFAKHLGLHPEKVGKISIAVTGVWFALIKLSPAANHLTSSLVELILDTPSNIALDPSDLVASVSLIPAWWLWKSIRPVQPRWSSLLILIVASFATMATSCMPIGAFTRLAVLDGNLYVLDERYGQVFVSKGTGKDWVADDDPPQQVLTDFERERGFPVVDCYQADPSICYRISGEEIIERSSDGGLTYQVAWQIPPGRRYFMDRFENGFLFLCGGPPDIGPYDLKLMSAGSEPLVVAASGNQGAIVGTESLGWERVSIGSAQPTPYDDTNPMEIFLVTFIEGLILIVVAFALTVAVSWGHLNLAITEASRHEALDLSGSKIENPASFSMIFLVVITMIIFLILAFPLLFYLTQLIPLLLLVYLSIALVGFAASWRRLSNALSEQKKLGEIPFLALISGLLVFPVAWLPFAFWVAGVIPRYRIALFMSLFLFFAAVYVGFWGKRKIRSVFKPDRTGF